MTAFCPNVNCEKMGNIGRVEDMTLKMEHPQICKNLGMFFNQLQFALLWAKVHYRITFLHHFRCQRLLRIRELRIL